VGVLYAGLMLTETGPRVLEFNCRLGDPETEVILPLLESDLVAVFQACLDGTLDQLDIRWQPGVAATVVASSEGYPGNYPKGREITGIAGERCRRWLVHAGTAAPTRAAGDRGRVLTVTGLAILETAHRLIPGTTIIFKKHSG
jgi:phosphoribosylamine--glycine ligase